MQSPLPHDYDSVQWRSLDITVGQPIVIAPGYTAAIENDPDTSPEELLDRLDDLPADVQAAKLVEIRLAIRPADNEQIDETAVVIVSTLAGIDFKSGESGLDVGEPLLERPLYSLPRDGDWAILEDPPPSESGDLLLVEVRPGEGSAGRWEYGVTPGRVPYGGWPAYSGSTDAPGIQPNTALVFQTTFEQDSNLNGILDEAGDQIGDTLTGDLPFVAGYTLAILAVAGGAACALMRGRGAS